jgi:resuscitation-promoting factor RpfB
VSRHLLPIVLVLLLGCSDGSPTAGPSTPTGGQPPTSPGEVDVPNVEGRKIRAAERILTEAGLESDSTRAFSKRPQGTVLRQTPESGVQAAVGSLVELVVAKTLPKVPELIGLNQNQASRAVRSRGFQVNVERETSSEPAGTVIAQTPTAGTKARLGRTITIVIAEPDEDCHPSYNGTVCLDPNATDYDCAGGTGDGPKYTGTVEVIGPDDFELDADGDGIGCE